MTDCSEARVALLCVAICNRTDLSQATENDQYFLAPFNIRKVIMRVCVAFI